MNEEKMDHIKRKILDFSIELQDVDEETKKYINAYLDGILHCKKIKKINTGE
ncbi:MAG: hypothetical protein ACRCWG_03125 [Sarcina sp.]